jgi:diguanylate cyclase (GGDEF)-like protein
VPNVLTSADVLRHVRPIVLVLNEVGTIVQAEGASLSLIGYDPASMIGRNALNYVSPRHQDAILFVFTGPDGHVVRDRHAPFPLELVGADGRPMMVDCAGQRVHHDGDMLWVVTLMPHSLQSASFHALEAYGHGAGALEVGATIARRLSGQWDLDSGTRSFLLADPVGGAFTTVSEPGREGAPDRLVDAVDRHVEGDAPWNDSENGSSLTVSVDALPAGIASAARECGFDVACVAIGRLEGAAQLAIVSFGDHQHAFDGTHELVIAECVATLNRAIARQDAEDKLRRAAELDSLTGLANQLAFSAALNERATSKSAVLYIDVDHFSEINSSFGRQAGDAILVEVGRRIRSMCRPDDVIARIGSDEFAVFLPHVDPTNAERLAHQMLARICEPLPEGVGPECIEASGGLALAACDDDAVERADLAMLAGKRAGRAQLVIT